MQSECRYAGILSKPWASKSLRDETSTNVMRGAPGETGWRSAIVNEAFVKRYLGGRNPLGVRIGEGSGPDAKPNIEIVGVMSNFSYRGLREESEQAYFPFSEGEGAGGTFYVRVRGTPQSFLPSLRDDRSRRRSVIANDRFPHFGRTGRSIPEHRTYAGDTVRQLRRTCAAAFAGWSVRRDVFCRDATHARDRYSVGAWRHDAGRQFGWCCAMRWR